VGDPKEAPKDIPLKTKHMEKFEEKKKKEKEEK